MNRVFAQDWTGTLGGPQKDVATIQSLVPIFSNVVRAVVALAGVGLLIMLLVGGFNFLFSGGDPKKLEAARGTIGSAFLGLIVIVVAYVILNAIGTFTGVTNITKFNINIPTP
jgi:hypothetical protein